MSTFTEYIKPKELKKTEIKPMIGCVVFQRTNTKEFEFPQKPVPPIEESTILGSHKEPEHKINVKI